MMSIAWDWARKHIDLLLLLAAMMCLSMALGEVIRGATWSLLIPVSLLAVVCGWGLAASRLNPKQAWACLTALGLPAVFIYVGGLIRPLGRLILSIFSLVPQLFQWLSERIPVDASAVLVAWSALMGHLASLFSRIWEWLAALLVGRPFVDPLAAGLVWDSLLWLIGAWAGWRLRRNRQALQALAPGGFLLALVLDYTRGEVGLLVVYLAVLLALIGLAWDEWRHVQWQRRKVDYSESIHLETLLMVGMVTIALTLSAAGTPSLSWRDLVDKFRKTDSTGADRVAESLGLERPIDAATTAPYLSSGLPRSHLLNLPPEQLQEVVFTVSTGELPPLPESVVEIHPNNYYWRTITYDVYSGAGWSSSSALDVPLPPNTPLMEPPQAYRPVTQHVKRVPDQGTYLYWTGLLAQVDTETQVAWRIKPPDNPSPVRNGDMLGALTRPDEYTVISYVPQFSLAQLRNAGSDYPSQIAERYLELPENTPERVLALARELTQAAPTPYDRAVAIEDYLRTFPYTLEVEPPPLDRDVVDYFLFTAQKGYCDYYATSMVVLARAVGLPARVVIGYTSGEYDAPTAEYVIRQENAHSWAEVYFSGLGWVEFEPTASQPAIDRGVVEDASGLSSSLPGGPSVFSWLKAQWRGLLSSLGGQLLIVALGLIILFAVWQVGELGFLYLLPSQIAVSRIYSRMEQASTRLLPDLPNGRTPHQFEAALSHKLRDKKNQRLTRILSPATGEIKNVVSLHVAQAFSEHLPTKTEVRGGVRAWMRLRWRLWIVNRWISLMHTAPRGSGRGRQ